MIQAYLRGYLKPQMIHGIRSRLRESLILSALEFEQRADAELEYLHLRQAFLQFIDRKAIPESHKEMQLFIKRITATRALNPSGVKLGKSKELDAPAAAMAHLYTALGESGFLDQFKLDGKGHSRRRQSFIGGQVPKNKWDTPIRPGMNKTALSRPAIQRR